MHKYISYIFILFLFSCSTGTKDEIEKNNIANVHAESIDANLNISILLDLSDRISLKKHPNQTMEYYERDLGYVKIISEAFQKHVRSKKIRQMNDHIQVYFDPAPANRSINQLSEELSLSFNRSNVTKDKVTSISNLYKTNISNIYELAIKDDNYVGSDIWGFFKKNVKDYAVKDDHRNILFILTDGYIFHENNSFTELNKSTYVTPPLIKRLGLATNSWKEKMLEKKISLIKANEDLDNLEVMVIGVNPSPGNPYESDIINEFWSNWMKEMEVKNFSMREAELPANISNVISSFILN